MAQTMSQICPYNGPELGISLGLFHELVNLYHHLLYTEEEIGAQGLPEAVSHRPS